MSVLDKFERVERILTDMDRELEDYGEFLLESSEVDHLVTDMNKEQMIRGKDANNKDIRPEYTERTKAIKEKKGQIYDRVTLLDTGEFQGGMKARNANKKLEILSEDSKSEALQNKYTPFIFGLNDQHLAMLRNYLKPKFQIFLRKYVTS